MPKTVKVTVIVPEPFKEFAFRSVLAGAVADTVNEADRLFAKTYASFKDKPRFIKRFSNTRNRIEGATETDNRIYKLLNDGTEGHPISAKNAPFLRFRWDGKGSYKPKTTPGVIGSRPATYPKTWQRRSSVWHPGHDGRNFDGTIQKLELPRFVRRVRGVLPRAARVSGHAM